MLAGAEITAEARAAAERLLKGRRRDAFVSRGRARGILHAASQSRDRTDTGVRNGPGSAAHRSAKGSYALRCAGGTAQSTVFVMPGLVPGIHVFKLAARRRGWPGQARP